MIRVIENYAVRGDLWNGCRGSNLSLDFDVSEARNLWGSRVKYNAPRSRSRDCGGALTYHLKEFIGFVSIARGSVAELETQIELARRIHYAPEPAAPELLAKLDNLGRQLKQAQLRCKKLREDLPIYDEVFPKLPFNFRCYSSPEKGALVKITNIETIPSFWRWT